MTCLVRTDFNFVFAFIGYYLVLTRKQDKDLYVLVINKYINKNKDLLIKFVFACDRLNLALFSGIPLDQ